MQDFIYKANPARVIFGQGTLDQLAEELTLLGITTPLFLSTPQQADQVTEIAETHVSGSAQLFGNAAMHTPTAVTEKALHFLKSAGADGIVSVGGGSTIGLGKALALRTNLPQLVVPTTYAGSEMTPILGETADGVKRTMSSNKVLPDTVIYDIDLTTTLPPRMSGLSGLNAIAHAVEALYAEEANPVTSLIALEAIGALVEALPVIMTDPSDSDARRKAAYGAWLCGVCLGTVGMALHHKLCHTLGGTFDLPHAETHSIVLPHALAYNAPAIPEVMAHLRKAMDTDDPARRLYELGRTVEAPEGLQALGMPEDGIGRAVELAMANPYWNPRPLEAGALHALIRNAHAGAPPS